MISEVIERVKKWYKPPLDRQFLKSPHVLFSGPEWGILTVRDRVQATIDAINEGDVDRYPIFIQYRECAGKGRIEVNRLIIKADNPGEVVLLGNINRVLSEASKSGTLASRSQALLDMLGGLR